MLHDVFAKCVEKLEPGGRIAVNVANLGRKPYRSLSADVITILQDRLGMLLRGEIIWQKGKGATGSTTWGSFQSPANPVLRDLTERIVVASKGRFDRAVGRRKRPDAGLPSVATMAKDDFMDATTDVWDIPPESATRVGHPAPFPAELPQRLIELYTYEGDVVLDPFMGSGSTAVAAVRTSRHFLGFDTDRHYVMAAKERVAVERTQITESPSWLVRVPAVKPDDDGSSAAAVELGEKATTLATRLLTESGFTEVTDKVKGVPHGVDISLQADDAQGRRWLIEIAGAFTTPRLGLRRTDVLWRTLGKASIVAASLGEKAPPLLVLTTDLPAASSGAAGAVAAVKGKTVVDVLDLTDPSTAEQLARYASGS
jgi:site-specific DNA-methyltransferase (adenine-specific)